MSCDPVNSRAKNTVGGDVSILYVLVRSFALFLLPTVGTVEAEADKVIGKAIAADHVVVADRGIATNEVSVCA